MIIVVPILVSCIVLYFITIVTHRFYELFILGNGESNKSSRSVSDRAALYLRYYLRLAGILDTPTQMKVIKFGRYTINVAAFCSVALALVFGFSIVSAFACSLIGTVLGGLGLFSILEARRKKFYSALLYDFPIFAQQLLMVSLSGNTLEEGFRKIAQVSAARRRFGAVEQLIFMAIERRQGDARLEDVILEIAEQVGSPEIQRAVRGKMESDRYGSALSNILRDLSEQSKIKGMKIKYFEPHSFLNQVLPERHKDSETTWRFVLLLSQKLALNYDTFTSLRMSADGIENGHVLQEDLRRLENNLKNGMPEEEALSNFARGYDTVGMNLLVQALLLSKLAPRKLREMIQEILRYLKAESLDR